MKQMIREHILVCLSSAPSNGNIIRTAAKMAEAFGGTLTALYVHTKGSDQMGQEDRQRLQRNTRLAEKLGAEISTVSGDDVAYQIAEFARRSKVTKVVIGRSDVGKGRLWMKKPLTEKLVEQLPALDIYIIPDMAGENTRHSNPAARERVLPNLWQIGASLGILLLCTLIGFLFQDLHFTEANIITLYILGVLLTAILIRNHLCSGVCSLVSVLLFNFFFAEPRLSFYAYASGYPVTFVITLFVALMTGELAKRLSENAKQSSQAAWRTQVLLQTNQRLQMAVTEGDILQVIAAQLIQLLNRPVVIYPAGRGVLEGAIPFSQEGEAPFEGEHEVAQWTFSNCKRAGASTGYFSEAEGLYLAIRSSGEAFGVVGFPLKDRPMEPLENSVLLSILGEGALAMENYRNARQKEEAAVLAKNEQLRANLLRAISHDLRTPLTSISGNAENLLVNDAAISEADRKAVLSDIYDDAIWLIQLVENLLAVTKIGDGRTQLKYSTELMDEVITESLRHIRRRKGEHFIETEFEDELLLARMDARLISQVIINLVDNAVKYTPADSPIRISAQKEGDRIRVVVADNGPGIPDHLKLRAFEMFFTGGNAVADCRRSMGLGLTLCKSIITLHGGEITLTDNQPSGCVFSFTLPASEVNINV